MSNIDGLASTFRGGVSGFLGHNETPVTPLPGTGGGEASVFDNLATVKYPTDPQTTGVWYGTGTKAQMIGSDNVVLGNNATALASNVTVVGANAAGTGAYATAVGFQSQANINSTAVGTNANALTTSVAVGYNTNSAALATSIGYEANAGQGDSIAIGNQTIAAKNNDIAIGSGATTSGIPLTAGLALNLGAPVQITNHANSNANFDIEINGVTYKLLMHT